MRSTFTIAAVLALLVAGGSAVQAEPVYQPSGPQADVHGFRGGPDALPRVIRHVETSVGGRVIEIHFADRAAGPGYDVVVAKGPQLLFLRLAREDGELTPITENSRPVWMLKWAGRADVHIGEHAAVPLDAAIRTAEDANGREPAVAAGVARSASNPTSDVHAYNILLSRGDGSTRRVAVDAATGQIISNPNALSDMS